MFGESGFTSEAAKTLDSVAAVEPESLCLLVFASYAGHRTFSANFLQEKSDNESAELECGLRPRLNLPPLLVQAKGR